MSAARAVLSAGRREAAEATRSELVYRAAAGDTLALDTLLRDHLAVVRGVCRRRLRDPHDIDDAVQETAARALRALPTLRDPDRFDAWIAAIAARVCIDLHRSRRHGWSAELPELVDTAASPDASVVAAEEAGELYARLTALPPRERRALWLRDAVGLPVAAVAEDAGVTEGSARVLLSRARARVRAGYHGVASIALVALVRGRQRDADIAHGPAAAWSAAPLIAAAVLVLVPSSGVGGGQRPRPSVGADALAGSNAGTQRGIATPGNGRSAVATDGRASIATTGAPSTSTSGPASRAVAPTPDVLHVQERPDSEPDVEVDGPDDSGVDLWVGDVAEHAERTIDDLVPPARDDAAQTDDGGVLGAP